MFKTQLQSNKLPHSDLTVTEVCLGTMIFGTQLDQKKSFEIMDLSLKEYGINFIDSAELYPVPMTAKTHGSTDLIIGQWLKQNPTFRNKLVITSKVIAYAPHLNWIRNGPLPNAEHFNKSLDDTLSRLAIDYLDLFLIHWPSRNTAMFGSICFDPAKERNDLQQTQKNLFNQVSAMNDLVKSGKIRSWGVSNENSWGLMKIIAICKENNFTMPCVIQNPYSLLNRMADYELSEVCYRQNIGFLSYSPLAFGHLTGKYLNSDGYATQNTQNTRLQFKNFNKRYDNDRAKKAVADYDVLAKKNNTTILDLALKFNQSRKFMSSTIIGASKSAQIHANVKSFLTQKLDIKLLRQIDKIHNNNPNPCP